MSLLRMLARVLLSGPKTEVAPTTDAAALARVGQALQQSATARLGRSLAIREVDAGSCNGCELELHAAHGPTYDLEHLGIRFVASPRHANVLLVTGPVTTNMAEALKRSYDAMPSPKWVVAMGDCAVDGGCFAGSYAVRSGARSMVPVDLTIPGCPPEPVVILSHLQALLGRG